MLQYGELNTTISNRVWGGFIQLAPKRVGVPAFFRFHLGGVWLIRGTMASGEVAGWPNAGLLKRNAQIYKTSDFTHFWRSSFK